MPGVKMMRLIVGKKCKIFVRGQDNFGNTRTTGGDNVEGVLVGPNGQRGLVSTKDHGDGSYLLEFTCMQQGVWTLRTRFNGRLSMERHKLIVSFGPLMAQDVRIQMPSPRSDVVLTRTCKLSSNDPKMDVFLPVQRRSTCVSFLRQASPLASRSTSSRVRLPP